MKTRLNKRSIVFKFQRPLHGDGDILAYGVDKDDNHLTNPITIPLNKKSAWLLEDGALKSYWEGRLKGGMFEPRRPARLDDWVY